MILGPYRNPPYRTPTPKSSLSPPPPHGSTRNPSPKRKLHPDEADVPIAGSAAGPAQSLRVDTTWNSDGSLVVPDSPRSKVAERLKDLAIRQARPTNAVTSPQRQSPSQSPRKKLKRNPHIRDLRGAVQARQLLGDAVQTPPQGAGRCVEIPDSESGNTTLVLEVDETILDDEDYAWLPPTPLRENGIRDLHQAIDMVMSSEDDAESDHYQRQQTEFKTSSRNNKRMLSPPPPSPLGQCSQGTNEEANLFLSKSPDSSFSDDATSFDPASLTWQDSETTGHEITSPDDDGEGINGIGFRPTPAIAYARSQKRRQQVEGWKAREAKEARQKRLERRRGSGRGKAIAGGGIGLDGANDGLGSDGGTTRRTVRFAT